MKKTLTIFLAVALVVLFVGITSDNAIGKEKKVKCPTIKTGSILYSATHFLGAQPLMTGYDPFGYNYQGHMFNGLYTDSYLGVAGFPPYDGDDDTYLAENPGAESHWAWPYRDVTLMMKWNDAWISNKDCDGDTALDRHNGFVSYIGSGAWLTNHQWGTYEDIDGVECTWSYFVKIVAAPSDAVLEGGVWYDADGTEIGLEIWGAFAIIQQVENDLCAGLQGMQYVSPVAPGFGKYKPGK